VSTRAFIAAGYVALAATLALVVLRPAEPVTPVHSLAAPTVGAAADPPPPVVAILLHPRDCADRVEALTAWNDIHRSGQARVVGLVAEGTGVSGELDRISRGAGISFPLRYVEARHFHPVLASLNYRTTPLAVLLDGAGRVRLTVPLDAGRARDAVNLVTQHLSSLEGFSR
jgi:hypothetical protein